MPFVVAVDVAGAASATVPLDHHWATTIAELNGSFPVLNPLVAALAAVAFAPVFSTTQRELTAATPGRGRRLLGLKASVVAGWLVLGHLMLTAGVLVWAWRSGTPGSPDLWGVLPEIGAIVAAMGAGTLAARVVPRWWVAPLLLVGGYVVLILVKGYVPAPFYRTGGASIPLYGLSYRPDIAALQCVGGVLLGCLFVVLAASAPRDPAVRPVTLLVLVVAVMLVAGALTSRGDRLYREVPVAWQCLGDAPRLCAVRESADDLGVSHERLVAAVGAVDRIGVPIPVPAVFRQPVGDRFRHDPREGNFSVAATGDPSEALLDVLQSASACSENWTSQQIGALQSALAFAVRESGAARANGVPDRHTAQAAVRDLMACP